MAAIICAISPAAINYYQTLSTLRFATRAKVIKVKAEALYKLNNKDEIEFYKREIKRLKQEIENNSKLIILLNQILIFFLLISNALFYLRKQRHEHPAQPKIHF